MSDLKAIEVEYNILKDKDVASYLLLTATDIEYQNVSSLLEPICNDGILKTGVSGQEYLIGRYGKVNVIVTKCGSMGTQETGSSMLTTQEAIEHRSCIKAVLMVGICFGLYDDGDIPQHYGDVLVSKEIFPYESQKVKDGEGRYRGKTHCADENLLKAFKIIKADWQEKNLYDEVTRIEVCQILTGEKLVDDKHYRDNLRLKSPGARGGEMEAMGVASPCEKKNIPWVIVKAICDFGDGNKQEGKEEKQDCASKLAAKACMLALQEVDVLSKIHMWNNTEFTLTFDKKQIKKDLFFTLYDPSKDRYYLKRSIDNRLERMLTLKGCWVSGATGVGKTTALMRSLHALKKEFLLINLAANARSSVLQLFETVYGKLCFKFNEKPKIGLGSYPELAEEIKYLLQRNCNGSELVLYIEEIPISPDNIEVFREFAENLFGLLIYVSDVQYDLKVVLSSMQSPKELIPVHQSKIQDFLQFYEMPSWSKEECLELINMIQETVQFVWDGYSREEFVHDCKYSPREIKNRLGEFFEFDDMLINRPKCLD